MSFTHGNVHLFATVFRFVPCIDSEGIAVAYLTRLLYWTDVTREEVSVSRLDGAFRKIIAPRNSGCETPRGIVLTNDQQ